MSDAQVKREPKRVLIICLRRIGDVLLATPLAASIRQAWPNSRIDWLVFFGTEGVLENNPAADQIFMISEKSLASETFQMLRRLAFKYDISISTQSGDRPALYARLASRNAFSLASNARGGFFRNGLLTGTVIANFKKHRVEQVLLLADLIGIQKIKCIQIPAPNQSGVLFPRKKFVVFHPGAAYIYKQWNLIGWRELTERIIAKGYEIAVTGGSSKEELKYLNKIFDGLKVERYDGKLSWSQLVALIEKAEFFVGVDTSVTHLAAAIGKPTNAIFGPTDPRIWSPWNPVNVSMIRIIQGSQPCIPCQLEGCERHIKSYSKCLDNLNSKNVLDRMIMDI